MTLSLVREDDCTSWAANVNSWRPNAHLPPFLSFLLNLISSSRPRSQSCQRMDSNPQKFATPGVEKCCEILLWAGNWLQLSTEIHWSISIYDGKIASHCSFSVEPQLRSRPMPLSLGPGLNKVWPDWETVEERSEVPAKLDIFKLVVKSWPPSLLWNTCIFISNEFVLRRNKHKCSTYSSASDGRLPPYRVSELTDASGHVRFACRSSTNIQSSN